MKKRIKKKWLKALRSGEYVQGDNWLCTKGKRYDNFCCLGVLTDLYLREKGEGWSSDGVLDLGDNFGFKGDSWIERNFLPLKVMEWSGIQSNDPSVGEATVADLNDSNMTFKNIATLIEKHL